LASHQNDQTDEEIGEIQKKTDIDALKDKEKRLLGVVSNDSESVPVPLVLFWGAGSLAAYGGHDNAQFFTACLSMWTILRILHTILYSFGIQGNPPKRTIIYVLGQVMCLLAGISGLKGAASGLAF
jgi:hypothetical protein